MNGRQIVGRRLVAATAVLLFLGCAGEVSANDGRDRGPRLDALRDRVSQRDTADIINRYYYPDIDPIDNHDPTGH